VKTERRRWSRWGSWVLIVIAAILILPPLAVSISPDPSIAATVLAIPAGTYRVYVADWGYHTSIIFQQPPTRRLGSLGSETAPFVEFAWGDRRFYMESNYRPDALFATLFLPTEAVAYVASWTTDPARGARARALYERDVDARELSELASVLEGTILHTETGERALAFPAVGGYAGRFYPAHGRYLWFTDCNRWTVERLASAGLAQGGIGVIFSGQVAGHLIGFHRVEGQ
jgi:uncharacterized protein DUF2459